MTFNSSGGGGGGGDGGSGTCLVSLMAQESLYGETAMELLACCYTHLVQELAANPSAAPLGSVQHFSPASMAEALSFGRGELRASAWEGRTLPEQVLHVAKMYPDKIAVKDGYGTAMSFRGLRDRVFAISRTLAPVLGRSSSSLTAGPVAAVYQEPSADWVCSMIAIMRMGAVYVPLDMATPVPRLVKIV